MLSVGVGSVTDVLRALGPVSRAAAVQGVAATASIDSGHAVTFQFEVEAGGNYTLLVRHDGAGLTLTAQTPAGKVAIDAGPAGPFEAVPLALQPGTYEVTAAARGGEPVFVDWELLLNAGVGQAASATPSVVLPSVNLPVTTSVPASGAATSGTLSAAAPGSAVAVSAPASSTLSLAQSDTSDVSRYQLGGLVGRSSTDSTAASPSLVALAPGATETPALGSLAGLDIVLLAGIQPAVGNQASAGVMPGEPSSFAGFAQAIGGELGADSAATPQLAELDPGQPAAGSPGDEADEGSVSLAAISPGIVLGAVVVSVATRRLVTSKRPFFTRTPAESDQPPDSPLLRLRAIFDRSYRAGRGQPLRPLRVTPVSASARLGPHVGSRRSW